jgi:two-component system copper resistance phosphate regulon response regulator CusR
MNRILVVEDDPQVARTVALGLREANYQVDSVADGKVGLQQAASGSYALVVLDLVLPNCDGIEILQQLRAHGHDVPVLILTGKSAVGDRVAGLDAGADDYLVKPFGLAELLARVRALLRRPKDLTLTSLSAADLKLDCLQRRAHRGDREIALTNREFELLHYLLTHMGEVIPRRTLAEKVWGYWFDTTSNIVDVHIAHLRAKLDEGHDTKLLHTVRGRGYVLRLPTEEPHASSF